jgi:gluconokinase
VTRVLALDVGTSSVRARLYDERGLHVEGVEAQERYTATRGHSGRLGEFDADELVDTVRDAVEEACREAGGGVAAVAVSCFWHSLVPVDREGRAIAPVQTWRDLRSAAEADELASLLGRGAVHARTGAPLHPSFWPAKLLWLRRRERDVFEDAARFLGFPDYLLGRLAGTTRTSLSMASGTGLLELASGAWDGELLEAVGVERERLPEISDEPVDSDQRWFPALGDGACSNLGVGCVTPERAALMVGTSGAYRTVSAERPSARRGLFVYRVDAERWVQGGSISDGGNLYDWLDRTLADADVAGVSEAPPDGHGLTFLTLLGGERSPGWNARARGAVAGLTFATEPRHLVQAALEGVAFRFAEIAELMPEVREVVATGAGLLKNPEWAQIVADVLGRPVTVSAVEEGSARGAAVAVLGRLGETPAEAPLDGVLEPRPERTEVYAAARERQRDLYERLLEVRAVRPVVSDGPAGKAREP